MKILDILKLRAKQGKKSIAVLVDPDKAEDSARLIAAVKKIGKVE